MTLPFITPRIRVNAEIWRAESNILLHMAEFAATSSGDAQPWSPRDYTLKPLTCITSTGKCLLLCYALWCFHTRARQRQDNDKTNVEPVHSYDAFHTRSDMSGVKGIIGMHRFNIFLIVLLWCENTITLDNALWSASEEAWNPVPT